MLSLFKNVYFQVTHMIFLYITVSTSQYLDFFCSFIFKSPKTGRLLYWKKKTWGKWFHSILCITTQYIHCGEEGGIQSQNKPRPLAVFNCYISSYHFTLSKHLHLYEICGFIYEVYANVSLINKGKKKKKLKNYGIQIKNVAWSL